VKGLRFTEFMSVEYGFMCCLIHYFKEQEFLRVINVSLLFFIFINVSKSSLFLTYGIIHKVKLSTHFSTLYTFISENMSMNTSM
jgi:hypothetical protein